MAHELGYSSLMSHFGGVTFPLGDMRGIRGRGNMAILCRADLGALDVDARHDAARLRGFFEATLDVNRAMGTDETRAAVLAAAGSLLRSPGSR